MIRKLFGYSHIPQHWAPQINDFNQKYLKPGISFEILNEIAHKISDNQAADQLQKARQILFKTIFGRTKTTG